MGDDINETMLAESPWAGLRWPTWVEPGEKQPTRQCPRCGGMHTVFHETRTEGDYKKTIWYLRCLDCREWVNAFDCRNFVTGYASCKRKCDNMRMYNIDGVKYPSVTTILAYLPDPPALANWKRNNPNAKKIFRESSPIGTVTHFRVENHLARKCRLPLQKLELDPSSPPFSKEMRERVEHNFQEFLRLDEEFNFTPTKLEQQIHHPGLMYAGTFDMLCTVDGIDGVILTDIKTGKGIYEKYKAQLWAYKEAYQWHGGQVDKCAVLRLGAKDSEFTIVEPDPDTFFKAMEIFVSRGN